MFFDVFIFFGRCSELTHSLLFAIQVTLRTCKGHSTELYVCVASPSSRTLKIFWIIQKGQEKVTCTLLNQCSRFIWCRGGERRKKSHILHIYIRITNTGWAGVHYFKKMIRKNIVYKIMMIVIQILVEKNLKLMVQTCIDDILSYSQSASMN